MQEQILKNTSNKLCVLLDFSLLYSLGNLYSLGLITNYKLAFCLNVSLDKERISNASLIYLFK